MTKPVFSPRLPPRASPTIRFPLPPSRCLYSTTTSGSPPFITATDRRAPHTGLIRILTLNHPPTRNALSRQLLHELRAQVSALTAPDSAVRVLILASGLPTAFCAGADLKERATFDAAQTRAFLSDLRATFALLAALPRPSIAAVHGVALGGGLELALGATFRVMAADAAVGLPETRLAIIPGAGGTYRLRECVGSARALDLILTGRRVDGVEAARIGLCERLVQGGREEVLAEALALAESICEGGPLAIDAALEAVRAGRAEVENEMYERVVRTEDRDRALLAFAEKRRPVFTGR